MKKQTFSVLFFIKPTQVLKTGEATIQMRITLCGQRWEMYLKARVVPKLWNQKKERATGKDGQCLDSIRARI